MEVKSRTNQRKANTLTEGSPRRLCVRLAGQLPQAHSLHPPTGRLLSFTINLAHYPPCLWISAKCKWWGLPALLSQFYALAFQCSRFKSAPTQRFHWASDKNGRCAHVKIMQLTLRDDLAPQIPPDPQLLGMAWPCKENTKWGKSHQGPLKHSDLRSITRHQQEDQGSFLADTKGLSHKRLHCLPKHSFSCQQYPQNTGF